MHVIPARRLSNRLSSSHALADSSRGSSHISALLAALALCAALLLPSAAAPSSTEAAGCEFVLGFKALHDLIPNEVGDCRSAEGHNPTNGDGLQETTGVGGRGGLLVWRKADNWTAYTDGYRTWINGPSGLQSRLNTERLSWEHGEPTLELARVPAYGSNDDLTGRVFFANSDDFAVLTYIKVAGYWWPKPTWSNPLTPIGREGAWTCDITTGGNDTQATEIRAFLVPRGFRIPEMSISTNLPDSLAVFPKAGALRSAVNGGIQTQSAP